MEINSDMGEIPRLLEDGTYAELMNYVTSINVACGGHAGNEAMMHEMVQIAKEKSVNIGAHPSYPDRENFGRVDLDITSEVLIGTVAKQVTLLKKIANAQNVDLSHVKPHGALYNRAVQNRTVAKAIAEGVHQVDPSLALMGLAGSIMLDVWKMGGFLVIGEAFADRTYEADGSLRNRKYKDALITEPEQAANQARQIIEEGSVTAVDGTMVSIHAETLCIHSDTPNAVELARAVRNVL